MRTRALTSQDPRVGRSRRQLFVEGEVTFKLQAPTPARPRLPGVVLALLGLALGLLALSLLLAASASASEPCPNETLREAQHSTALPDCRAYEMVSPPDKGGGQVVPESTRTQAAAGDGGLPPAVSFLSLAGFGDVQGTGIGTEYLAERDQVPGSNGWSTHGITPAQEPLPVKAVSLGYEPSYVGEMSRELTKGLFRSWSAVTAAPNAALVPNLYVREDLRTPGAGLYRLVTDPFTPLPAPNPPFTPDPRPYIADATPDMQHVLFESHQNLTSDASGNGLKVYETDGGVTQLVFTGSAQVGHGASLLSYTPRTLSQDGTRANFVLPEGPRKGKLLQRDDRGTPSTADDAFVHVNASEASVPESPLPAEYETASVDGSRVFFLSPERLTDDAVGRSLYMWQRQPTNEVQSLALDASGGTFTLSARGAARDGSTEAATTPLPSNATAAQLQSALEALPVIGAGNVSVSGGPGSAGASNPYTITFIGGLAGVDVSQLAADATNLTGGASTAAITTITPVHNLTLIAPMPDIDDGVIGASEDGHRLYFASRASQLVSGAPGLASAGLYYWHDADATPGATLSFIGGALGGDLSPVVNALSFLTPKVSRVTPDGKTLAFEASDGSGLLGYDQSGCDNVEEGGSAGNPNNTGNGCSEVYVYRTDGSTPTKPNLLCASCLPSGAPETRTAWLSIHRYASATRVSNHLARVLSDDGHRVFFSTQEALVPQDTNGKYDAYEYDIPSHTPHLLSTGKDTFDSFFLDASANGNDAYFATRQQLLGWDTDNVYDLYDVRVDGGLPEPPTSPQPCTGEACLGAASTPPGPTNLASSALSGSGNLSAPVVQLALVRPLSNAQKLSKALKACRGKHSKRKRIVCEREARRRYGAHKTSKKKGGSH